MTEDRLAEIVLSLAYEADAYAEKYWIEQPNGPSRVDFRDLFYAKAIINAVQEECDVVHLKYDEHTCSWHPCTKNTFYATDAADRWKLAELPLVES